MLDWHRAGCNYRRIHLLEICMTRRYKLPLAACALIVAAASPLAAQDRSAPLLRMLQALPASFVTNTINADYTFGDPAAAAVVIQQAIARGLMAAAIGNPAEPILSEFAEPIGPMLRTASRDLGMAMFQAGPQGWAPLLGFGADDIDQFLTVLNPPLAALMVTLDPALIDGIGPVLIGNGYAPLDFGGVPAFLRGENDYQLNLELRNPADPFGGNLGRSSRIALLAGGMVLQSSGLPDLQEMLDREGPKLGDDPLVQSLLAALDDSAAGTGPILRAVLFPAPDVLRVTDTAAPGLRMALLADISDGRSVHATLALAYDSRAEATAAAQQIAARWSGAVSPRRLASYAEVTGQSPVITVLGDAPALVLLTLTAVASFESFSGNDMNAAYDWLLSAVYTSDMVFLPEG